MQIWCQKGADTYMYKCLVKFSTSILYYLTFLPLFLFDPPPPLTCSAPEAELNSARGGGGQGRGKNMPPNIFSAPAKKKIRTRH